MRILGLVAIAALAACGGDDGAGGDVRTVHASGALWGARFSPDGSRLAVAFGPDDKLGTIDLASGALTELADNTSYLTGTAWAADGSGVYYNGSGGVYLVHPGDALPEQVNDAFASLGLDAAFGAAGARLVYGINGTDAELYDVATQTPRGLGRSCQAVRFAPDGRELACVSNGDLVLIDATTLAAGAPVVSGLPFIVGLDWYADGQHLVVTTDAGLERIGRDGSRGVLVDTFAAIEVDLAPDDKSVVFATNGSPDLSIVSL